MVRAHSAADHTFDPPEGVYLLFDPMTDAKCPYVTTRSHTYKNGVLWVSVPPGFRFDFASIPGWLLWLFAPGGRHQRAAMFHDRLYQREVCSRFTADAVFRSIMAHDGVSWWRRVVLFYAVRLFGWWAWRKHREANRRAR